MNLKKKSNISVIAIHAIILTVYLLLFFLIPFKKTSSSWIEFAFSVFAILFSLAVFFYTFKNKETIVSKVYGFPLIRLAYIYLFVQMIIALIVCIISVFITIPVWIIILISVILLAFVLVGLMVVDNGRDLIEKIDTETARKTQVFETLRVSLAGIIDNCNNGQLKNKLQSISEKFRYSDPVSSEETKLSEDKMINIIADLSNNITNNESYCESLISDLEIALNEHNRISKTSKKHI